MSISYYTDYTHEVSLWLMVIPSYGPQLFFCNDLSGSVAQNLRFFYRLLQVVRLMVMRRRTRTRTRMRMMPAMTIHRWFYWSMILSDSHFSVYMINIHINIYIYVFQYVGWRVLTRRWILPLIPRLRVGVVQRVSHRFALQPFTAERLGASCYVPRDFLMDPDGWEIRHFLGWSSRGLHQISEVRSLEKEDGQSVDMHWNYVGTPQKHQKGWDVLFVHVSLSATKVFF